MTGRMAMAAASSASDLGSGGALEGIKHHAITVAPAPPAPPPAPQLTPVSMLNSPAEIYTALVNSGVNKSKLSLFKMAVSSMQSGFYLGFGFTFCLCCIGLLGNTIYGALAFPMALLLIILTGSELFTGNTCCMFASWVERKTSIMDYFRVCVLSYIFNFVGCLILVEFLVAADVWGGRESWVTGIAIKKVSNSWSVTFTRGILANWLVNLAIFQSVAARDVMGKAVGAFLPIIAFVTIGFEHSVANMFVIPMSMEMGSGISVGQFIGSNLVPVTIGNWIGGWVCTGLVFSCCLGNTIPDFMQLISDRMRDKTCQWSRPLVNNATSCYEGCVRRRRQQDDTVQQCDSIDMAEVRCPPS